MEAVAVALLIGIVVGLVVRPVVDMYIRWKTAKLYADMPVPDVDPHDARTRDRRR